MLILWTKALLLDPTLFLSSDNLKSFLITFDAWQTFIKALMKLKALALFLLAILAKGARFASYVIIGLPTDLCGVGERTRES